MKVQGQKENKAAEMKPAAPKSNWFVNLLFHEDVYYRMGGFLILGLVVFFISWAIFAFGVKQNGIMTDTYMVQKFFKSDTVAMGAWGTKTFGKEMALFGQKIDVAKTVSTWGNVGLFTFKYFINHLIFVILFVFLLNFFKIGRWSLGLIYFLCLTVMWGAVVGSNSLSFPAGDNPLLGSLVLFGRYGVWIWFSYLMLVLSTTQFAWVVAPKWLGAEWQKVRSFWPVSFTPEHREIFFFGLLFLLAASFAEARIFVHYNLNMF